MFCVHCGTKLDDSARFCSGCGKPVAAPAPAVPLKEAVPVAPVAEDVPVAAVVEEVPAEQVAKENSATPVVEEAPAEPVAEETPAEQVAEEIPAAPVAEDVPAVSELDQTAVLPPVTAEVPAAAETIAEGKAQKKDKKARPVRTKPHIVLRVLTQFLSFLLCLVLLASLVGTVALADLNRIMSKNGIQQLVNSLTAAEPRQAAVGSHTVSGALSAADARFAAPADIPEDILTGGDSQENIDNLARWLYNMIAEQSDKPLEITEAQILTLVREPAISAFIAEKLAGFARDFINDTKDTTITADELVLFIDGNQALIEQVLDIEMTEETMADLEDSVRELVDEQDLAATIQVQVFDSVETAINDSLAETGMTWEKIQPAVQFICSGLMLGLAIGLCVVLMLLLIALNFYNVPGGLVWIGVPCILVGGIFTGALALVTLVPKLFPDVPVAAVQLLSSFGKTLLPIHGAVLGFGLLLVIVAIIWSAVRKSIARKHAPAKA